MFSVDISGRRFGRLVAIRRVEFRRRNGRSIGAVWLCRCDCGTEKAILLHSLRTGRTISCGNHIAERNRARKTHGATAGRKPTPEYQAWLSMKDRCLNPADAGFRNYGMRGIQICQKWKESFQSFLRDMGPRPSADHTLERSNNSKGYSPKNCIWATRSQQARNRRNNFNLRHAGKTMCLADWAHEIGIDRRTLWYRLRRYGWSTERALTTPAKQMRWGHQIAFGNRIMTIAQWAEQCGISYTAMSERLERWPLKRALTTAKMT